MKVYYCVLALLVGSFAFSQELTDAEKEQLEEQFEDALNLQFSKIVTGNSFSNFGNFAAVSSDDKSLSAAVNIIENRRHILNIKASGGATNGVSELFTGTDLNSNVGVEASFHWISPFHEIRVGRNIAIRKKYDVEEQELQKKFKIDSIGALFYKDLTFAELNLEKSKKYIDKLNTMRQAGTLSQLKSDSLSFEIEKAKFEYDELQKKAEKLRKQKEELLSLKGVSEQERADILLEDLRQKRDLALKKLKDKRKVFEVDEVKFSWFSFGVGIRNDAFKLFDATQELSKQIIDTSYTSQSANIAYSHYDWSSANVFDIYYSVGASFSNASNLGTLSEVEVSDIRSISQDPNREAAARQSVFEGSYDEGIKSLIPFVDFYLFYGRKQTVALHVNPTVVYQDNQKPISSLKLGVLIPFINTEKQTSTVNLEVFYKLNDIFDTLDSEESLLDRNTIGLQASFPISFL